MTPKFKSPLVVSFALLVLDILSMTTVSAQPAPRRSTPNDTLKSIDVAPDKKVTFRIYAPKAEEVSVGGDFGPEGKMTKEDQGVWSFTVGPLTPEFYCYTFTVDDVRTVDPKNPMIKPGVSSLESMFLVTGDEAKFAAIIDVPHGEVRHLRWQLRAVGEAERKLPRRKGHGQWRD